MCARGKPSRNRSMLNSVCPVTPLLVGVWLLVVLDCALAINVDTQHAIIFQLPNASIANGNAHFGYSLLLKQNKTNFTYVLVYD